MTTETNMLRIGVVSSVQPDGGKARVYFPAYSNMVSDWLYVLRFPNAAVEIEGEDVPVKDWKPAVNDKVLCAFLYGENTDGFILGAIK